MAKSTGPVLGWWGEQWFAFVEEEHLLYPMTSSLKRAALRGDAVLTFSKGQVKAQVEVGKYGDSETATLKIKPLTDRQWRKVVESLSVRSEAAQRLLAGSPGPELEAAFVAADSALFPESDGRLIKCTCWEQGDCRHARVLAVRGSAMVDANPFLWLQVLGRSREELQAAVRAKLEDRASGSHRQLGALAASLSTDRYFTTDLSPESIPVRAGETGAPDTMLRLLGPVPLPEHMGWVTIESEREVSYGDELLLVPTMAEETVDDTLARYMRQISEHARDLAKGDMAPNYMDDPVPGKRVPQKSRLLPEIEAALAQADGPVSVEDLHTVCPTAAALPWDIADRAIRGALPELPEAYVTLAGEYVVRRTALLAGTQFRHVVSFSDWHSGQLVGGSDWEDVLALAGQTAPAPFLVGNAECSGNELFARLSPEVGDELQLSVVDIAPPRLAVTLRRRAERTLAERLEINRHAVGVLLRRISWTGDLLSEQEAVELLLAEGYYREGRCPDPIWLLPARAIGPALHWARDRHLTTAAWRSSGPTFGRDPRRTWWDRKSTMDIFGATLTEAGYSKKDIKTALAVVEAWCGQWPGDQRDAQRPPTLAALLYFLWTVAPILSLNMRIGSTVVPDVMTFWFRFLGERYSGLQEIFRPHLAACHLREAFAHRLGTYPVGSSDKQGVEAWYMEGFRWIGAELFFTGV